MAKRRVIRKEGSDEEPEEKAKPAFVPPEFDETDFLQTENKSAKMIYLSLGVAVIMGVVSYGIMMAGYRLKLDDYMLFPIAGALMGVPLALYLFNRFGIDLKELNWKKYLENGFMYALAWFVVWLISMNPPFSDFSEPVISEFALEVESESESVKYHHSFFNDKEYFYKDGDIDNVTKKEGIETNDISDLEGIDHISVYFRVTDNYLLRTPIVRVEEKVDGDWDGMDEEELIKNNISISKPGGDDLYDPEDYLEDDIRKEWLGVERESWEGNLWHVSFDFSNLTDSSYQREDGEIELRIVVEAEDGHGNEDKSEYSFKVQI